MSSFKSICLYISMGLSFCCDHTQVHCIFFLSIVSMLFLFVMQVLSASDVTLYMASTTGSRYMAIDSEPIELLKCKLNRMSHTLGVQDDHHFRLLWAFRYHAHNECGAGANLDPNNLIVWTPMNAMNDSHRNMFTSFSRPKCSL